MRKPVLALVMSCVACVSLLGACSSSAKPKLSARAQAVDACQKLETFLQQSLNKHTVDPTSLDNAVKAASDLRRQQPQYRALGTDILSSLQATDTHDTQAISTIGARVQRECIQAANP